ncbi:MAG: hypothetical protein J0L82_11860 [Deltaproteobacteria bacterium]|nr:hypothetical protein [Deltaproteobacteria bacterium]
MNLKHALQSNQTNIRKFVIAFSLIAFVAAFFGDLDDSEARRKRRSRVKRQKVINEKNLFERIGGKDPLGMAVDEWIRLALADTSLATILQPLAEKPAELAKTRKRLQDELCELVDGPCPQQSESEWVSVRTKLKLDETNTVAFTSLLSDAMLAKGFGERERNELLGRLGTVEPLAVSEATGPASERRGGNR